MPSYKDKAEKAKEASYRLSDVNYRFDEMEARSLVDGAILREIRSRVQQLSLAADASSEIEKLAHIANQLKINFGEIETLAGVTSSVILPPGEYTAEAVLNNLNQRMSDLLAHLKTSRTSSEAIIREIMGYPIASHVADGKIRIGADKMRSGHVLKEVFPEHRDIHGGIPKHEQRPNPPVTPVTKSEKSPARHEPTRPGSAGANHGPATSAGHKPIHSTGNIAGEQKGGVMAGIFGNSSRKNDQAQRH